MSPRLLVTLTLLTSLWYAGATHSAADTPPLLTGGSEDEFLPPDEAFRLSGEITGPNTLLLSWDIAPDYYLYKAKIKVASDSDIVQLGTASLPKGEQKTDEYFGTQEVYHRLLDVDVPFARASPAAGTFAVRVTYQGCAEAGLCYPPITKALELVLPAVDAASLSGGTFASAPPAAEQDRLAAVVRDGSIFAVLGIFLLAGLALTFTPCVLPMVPILSGIIAGQGDKVTPTRAFTLSLTYVLAMALTYTVAGVLAGLFGQNLQAALQNPWVLGVFALVFVALAFSMFG